MLISGFEKRLQRLEARRTEATERPAVLAERSGRPVSEWTDAELNDAIRMLDGLPYDPCAPELTDEELEARIIDARERAKQ
jgi:hypothetical protein